MEDLPKPLTLINASLNRQAASLAMLNQLQQALRQAQSPISFVRQDGYSRISALLEEHLTDLDNAGPVLEALLRASCWEVLLGSLRSALASVGDGGGGYEGVRRITETEVVALLSVVQVQTNLICSILSTICSCHALSNQPFCRALQREREGVGVGWCKRVLCMARGPVADRLRKVICMFHSTAKHSMCDRELVQLFLARLPAAQPALVCACLDTLLSLQLNYPPAFQLLVELGGMQQVSRLIQSPATPDKVRSWAARFLNLTLAHLAPALLALPDVALPGASSSDGGGGGTAAAAADVEGAGAGAASLQLSLDAAKRGVEEVLGRDAAALLGKRLDLQDRQAESRLEQLGQAVVFLMQQ